MTNPFDDLYKIEFATEKKKGKVKTKEEILAMIKHFGVLSELHASYHYKNMSKEEQETDIRQKDKFKEIETAIDELY